MLAVEQLHGGGAGPDRSSLEMDGACSARTYAAPEFCAGQAEFVAKEPEEGHGGIALEGATLTVDKQLHAEISSRVVEQAPGWKISALLHHGQ
jgi:hypothetical protein